VNFLSKVTDLRVFSYTAEALRLLKEKGFYIIVLTNQSGIGRALYTEADMHGIHDAMQEALRGAIDAFYFCPHVPDAGCQCRKPGLGMIQCAQTNFDIDLEASWMIGDKKLDVETARNAGIGSALVLTGYGRLHRRAITDEPDVVGEDLLDAVKQIVHFGRAAALP
jgi:D-glycero-D-manno-heptose 1,7-bisphosphate phosphatase